MKLIPKGFDPKSPFDPVKWKQSGAKPTTRHTHVLFQNDRLTLEAQYIGMVPDEGIWNFLLSKDPDPIYYEPMVKAPMETTMYPQMKVVNTATAAIIIHSILNDDLYTQLLKNLSNENT